MGGQGDQKCRAHRPPRLGILGEGGRRLRDFRVHRQPERQLGREVESVHQQRHRNEPERSAENDGHRQDPRRSGSHKVVPPRQDHHGRDDREREHPDHTVDEHAEQRPRLLVRRLAHDEKNLDDVAAGRAEEEQVEKHSREHDPQGAPIGKRDVLHPQQDEPAPCLEQQRDAERGDPRNKPPEPASGFRFPDRLKHLTVLRRVAENPPEQADGDQNLDGWQKIFFHSENRCAHRSIPADRCPERNGGVIDRMIPPAACSAG